MKHFPVLKKLPLAIAVAAGLSQTVFAEQTLETVVVSATRFDMPEVITPNSVIVIDRKKLDAMGASSLADALRAQPGLQVSDMVGDGSRAVVSMRGFGANAVNNTLIMVDGRKLNNPSLEAPALSAISMNDIERIEIIDGSGGTLYGDQAVGGVINIITRKPTKEPYLYVEGSAGSLDAKSIYGTASQLYDNGFAYRVSTKSHTTDNYRDNNAADYADTLARIEQNGDWGQVFLETQHIHDGLRMPGALNAAQTRQNRKQTTLPNDFSNNTTDMLRLGSDVKLSDNWSVLAEFTDRDTDTQFVQWAAPGAQGTHVSSFSPRLKGALPSAFGTTYLTAGYDYQGSDYQNTSTFANYVQDSDAYYAQVVYPFYTNWSATIGMRDATVHDKNKSNNKKRDDNENISEYGVSWKPVSDLRLFARQAGVLRFANADENGFTLPGVNFLNTQTGTSDEIGAEFQQKSWDMKLLAFDMDLDNEIYYDSNFLVSRNVNLPSSHRTGTTLSGEYRFTDDLAAGGNMTLLETELTSGSFKGNEVPFVAKRSGTAYVQWTFMPHLSLYTDAVYTGSRYMADDDANTSNKESSHWVYNTAVRWDWQQLNASLRVNNLTAEKYSNYISKWDFQYPSPERTLELTVGYKF
ncbi:MAG TPA: TonB-dependent receptor [Pseudomonadales bacterium]|nr:TonB-dependent receptor [Pseudomonadales bacterium]